MTRLRDAISVDGSARQSMLRLEHFFEALRGKDGVSRLRLRVPAAARGLALERQVWVYAQRVRGEANLNDLMLVRWGPEGTGVFPAFEGTLIVRSENGASSIELDGNYMPPFGAAGQVFDATIGRHIAESTARELLKDIKAALER